MAENPFVVKEKSGADRWEKRYILVSPITGEIIDDAQGYGYKSRESAAKAGWYKFKGGKAKKDSTKRDAEVFWKKNEAFAKAVNDYFECNFKEIARGEEDSSVGLTELAAEMKVAGFNPKFVEYLR